MKLKRLYGFAFVIISGLIIFGVTECYLSKKWAKEEKSLIQNYINTLGDTVYVLKPSGLYYIEIKKGTGRVPVANDTVFFRYKINFLDGNLLDTNIGKAKPDSAILGLGYLIQGVEEGLTYMKDGGKSLMVIPSSLAYGPTGYYYISGYTPFRFEIELVGVKPGTK